MKLIISKIQYFKLSTISRRFIPTSSKYQTEYRHSLDNKVEFWNKAAKDISWVKPCSVTMDDSVMHSTKWFVGSQMNMSYNCVDRHVEEGFGDQTALIYDSPITGVVRKINYKQLQESVSRLAGVFAKHGLRTGDCILIYLPMIPETLITMLASVRLGAIHSLVFGGFAAKELSVRIKHCEPKIIVTTNVGIEPGRTINYTDYVNEAISLSGFSPKNCIIYNRPGYKRADLSVGRDLDWEHEIHETKPHDPIPVDGNHPLYILYTSGTTGLPKGVVRPTAGYAVALKWSMKNLYGISPGETWWAASDFGWVVGHSYICYGPLLHRCTTIIYEGKPVGTPDASQYFRVLNWHNPVSLFVAPTALRAIRREDSHATQGSRYNHPNFRTVFVAGEHCDVETLSWARKIFKVPILDNWWQTETGWPITCPAAGLETKATLIPPPGSAGRPVPGYDIKIIDVQSGNILGPGELGRIVIKLPLPPGMTSTLYKNDEMFHKIFFTRFPGYYDTMDAGMSTKDGYVMVMARDDDVINVAGHRISSGAIEEACLMHHSIAECAVVGLNDSLKGQVPLALLVPESDINISDEIIINETIKIVREHIGSVASFKYAVVVHKLPKTRSGKISRNALSSMANGKPFKAPVTLEDPAVFEQIFNAFVKLGLKPSQPDK